MALSFDGKSGKTREIKDDNFSHFTKKIVLSFDRKPGKTCEIREIGNDNFDFTRKNVVLSFERKSGNEGLKRMI